MAAPAPVASRWVRAAVCLALTTAWLAGCSNSLDWREVVIGAEADPGGSKRAAMVVTFPCRPASHARDVPLAGAQRRMTMQACSAGGSTYAAMWVDVDAPHSMDPVIAQLVAASMSNFGVTEGGRRAVPMTLPGSTPWASAGRWRADGQSAKGERVTVDTAVQANGLRIVQITRVSQPRAPQPSQGPAPAIAARANAQTPDDPFFSSLRWQP